MASIKLAFPKEIADQVFAKTDGTCTYCGAKLVRENYGHCGEGPPDGSWEADHWHPSSAGGKDELPNLWPACCECNHKKATDDGELYILRRALFENNAINREIVQRLIDAGPGRGKMGPN